MRAAPPRSMSAQRLATPSPAHASACSQRHGGWRAAGCLHARVDARRAAVSGTSAPEISALPVNDAAGGAGGAGSREQGAGAAAGISSAPADASCHGRRAVLTGAAALLAAAGAWLPALPAAAAAAADDELLQRVLEPSGKVFSPGPAPPWAPKQTYYPDWLFGEWRVRSKLVRFQTPLGPRFADPSLARAAAAPPEQGGVGATTEYRLRFYSTLPPTLHNELRVNLGLGLPVPAVVADRAFNTRQTTNATMGFEAVQSVDYDPRESPDRETVVMARVSPDMRPLPPRRYELYINSQRSRGGASPEGRPDYVTAELNRQVLLGVRQVDVSDYEVMTEFVLQSDGAVTARQRTALYLEPRDALYFEARGAAAVVYDFELELEREAPPADAPRGAVACVLTPKGVSQCI